MSEASLGELRSLVGRVAVAARYLDDFSLCWPTESCPEETFPAASVIKIGIMSCLLDGVRAGRMSLADKVTIAAHQQVGGAGVLLELEPERDFSLAELCRLMMVVSDNTASNALVRHLGIERLNAFWAQRGYDSTLRRYFMDPVVEGRDNHMTALGAAKMLRDLYLGSGLDENLRDFAVGCLRRQQYREKIPLMLPEKVIVGHKTGELDGVRHDAAVVEAERPYILVVLTAQGSRQTWRVDQAIGQLSLNLYQTVHERIKA
jgi:beta-lactamase class A